MKRVISTIGVAALLVFATSCAQTQKPTPTPNNNEPVVSSTPPFQTREPERYRALRTITTVTANGETLVTKNWIARDGELRRDESDAEGQRVVYLDLQDGSIVMLPTEKLFADTREANPETDASEESENSPDRLLHTQLAGTTYQRIGVETISGRNTQKYRVVVNSPPDPSVSVSDTVIWVDDALQMPIKSEMKSSNGAHATMELSEISLEVDQSLFRVPDGYKKITFTELLKRLKLD